VEDAGLEIIPRTASYDGWNDTKYAAAVLASYENLKTTPKYMIVGGESVIGYDDGTLLTTEYLKDNNISIGLIENTTQRQNLDQHGVDDVVKASGYDAVRIFSVWDYIQNRYQYYGYEGAEEIENTLYRTVVERNIRVIYYKPIKEYKDQHVYVTDLSDYKTMFANLNERLAAHGIVPGERASVMTPYQVSLWEKVIMALGCVAGAVLLFGLMIPVGQKWKYGLLILGALCVFAAYFVAPGYSALLTSFAAAVIFPCIVIFFLIYKCREWGDSSLNNPVKNPELLKTAAAGVIALAVSVVICLIGGIMTAAPISSVNFMLEIDIFRGVKLAQILPLVYFVAAFLACYGFGQKKRSAGLLEFCDYRNLLGVSIKVWMILLGAVLLLVGYYYIERTGHESSVEVSGLEMIFRNALENILIARPRSKEFLCAFPAVLLLVYSAIRNLKFWTVIFGLASVIGMTSVVNTFMHIRTPIYLGIYRTGFSLLFGIIIGLVCLLIFDALYKLYKRLAPRL